MNNMKNFLKSYCLRLNEKTKEITNNIPENMIVQIEWRGYFFPDAYSFECTIFSIIFEKNKCINCLVQEPLFLLEEREFNKSIILLLKSVRKELSKGKDILEKMNIYSQPSSLYQAAVFKEDLSKLIKLKE